MKFQDCNPLPLEEIQSWLEWAGQSLLSLRVNGTRPSSYRSFWPDYPDDVHTAYGYSNTSIRAPSPGSQEIPLMDEILNLVSLTPVILQRRIINARILIRPLNGKYLYSWSRIALEIHLDRRAVKSQYNLGLQTIAGKIPDSTAQRFRSHFKSGPLSSS